MAQHQCAVFLEMVAEAQGPYGGQKVFEQRLALDQRRVTQVKTVEEKGVEKIEDKTVAAVLAEVGLQGGKIGSAAPFSTTISPSSKAD